MAEPTDELYGIIQQLIKEHHPAVILVALSAEYRQNAEFERDNNNSIDAQGWDMAASRIEGIINYVDTVAP